MVRPTVGLRRLGQGDHAPFGGAADPVFIADPTHVRSFDSNDGFRPQFADQVVPGGVIVRFRDASVGVGAVEPDLVNGPVIGQQFVKLVEEVAIVVVHFIVVALEPCRRRAALAGVCLETGRIGGDRRAELGAAIAVVRAEIRRVRAQLVQISGRKVDAELDVVFSGRFGDLANLIALASPPRTAGNRVVGVASLPQAQPVVVLADEDQHLAVGILDGAHPLLRVERRGIEDGGVLPAVAPLDAAEGVRAVMEEEGPFHPHPRRLVGTRQDLHRLFRDDRGGVILADDLQRAIGN